MEYKLISEINFQENINGRVFARFLAKDEIGRAHV